MTGVYEDLLRKVADGKIVWQPGVWEPQPGWHWAGAGPIDGEVYPLLDRMNLVDEIKVAGRIKGQTYYEMREVSLTARGKKLLMDIDSALANLDQPFAA